MRKSFLLLGAIVFCGWMVNPGLVQADDVLVSTESAWKDELAADRQEVKEEVMEAKESAKVAKTEEMQLQEQIRTAEAAGDKEVANQLKEQLRLLHKENVQERIQDRKDIHESKLELKEDVKEARREGYLPPKIGKWDKDNNPPGPKGGAGTNWENPPGPKGGPGASPNRRGNK
jgi:hypothetical protein